MDELRYREAEQRLWRSLDAAPTDRSLPLDRTGVTVRVQELGEGPPIVFVHGGSISGTSWAPLAARLPGVPVHHARPTGLRVESSARGWPPRC